ncbi:bifunctional anthranilate synthase component II/anthranilate phosphoribosyltransferase [Thiospirochaeta perfilievii]|uniref:Anthranilate phosphoribosyltransferase n=1 Tax=Thiospirochaeta perfilievii TaxID=252967 RepID=A0A5C1QG01_9SPIO|nr:bifunctional anthranilate synthase component II/anthranilate phosphoribosyltransferase [Thiospirochaeta perfilievii]QEN06070.1 bifunctional anthranilate synthase component II/anthranilate phosphoribosyltransferase [Thiospirochaeta perfilievii]
MILILDNFDSFTFNVYQQLLQVTNEDVKVIRNNKISVDEVKKLKPTHIIISPGPGRPEDAGISIDIIKEFKGVIPILGVCLGHQAIISAFGGDIIGAKNIVHGKVEPIKCDGKGIFRNLGSPINFTRYHSLVGDINTLPECFEITSTSSDGEIMGVRHKEYDIEGVQFHPESIASENGLSLFKNFINYKREPFDTTNKLERIISGEDLTFLEAKEFMEELTDGNLSDSIISAFSIALNCKGISSQEIAGCAKALRDKRTRVNVQVPVIDTCGTGGDGLNTFNISSFSALIVASCGVNVAKHGSRAVSSKSGSSDFYTELGISLESDPNSIVDNINNTQFSFMFAPHFHKAMRFAAPVRKELKIKTIFNLIGPLSNPASADYQVIGVWDERFCLVVAKAAKLLGVKKVMVVHGLDGIDEISISDKSRVVYIDENDKVEEFIFDPKSEGIPMYNLSDLSGGSAEVNASMAREILNGGGSEAIKAACSLNAGAALMVYGRVSTIIEGYELAMDAIESGKVKNKLVEIVG